MTGSCAIVSTITAIDSWMRVITLQTASASARPLRRRHFQSALAALALVVALTPARAASDDDSAPARPLSKEARLKFIRRAQVWRPTDVSAMDLRVGPDGSGAFSPGAVVTCDYVPTKKVGHSKKFDCAIGGKDVVKVRYGDDNGEVQGSALASRLLWALGFGADRVYPARVVCRGCSSDPWNEQKPRDGEQTFDPAAIERKPEGQVMKTVDDNDPGWSWQELSLVDAAKGGASLAQRDALTLLAVMIQHTDSKPEQQRLVCLPGGVNAEGWCDKPFLAVHDAGLTFGHGNLWNDAKRASVNFGEWEDAPVWRDPAACIAHLSRSQTGTLGDPRISEEGRAFLAGLLEQLSDAQLRDLFEVSRVDRRRPDASTPAATVDQWMAAFEHKRDEIVTNRCPAGTSSKL
jgi:hypothetical protein